MRIYISGRITGTTDYMRRFRLAEMLLEERGLDVVNPAKLCASLPTNFTHNEYMKVCLSALDSCDAIYMLTGYEKSKGAMIELGFAKGKNLRVYGETEVINE